MRSFADEDLFGVLGLDDEPCLDRAAGPQLQPTTAQSPTPCRLQLIARRQLPSTANACSSKGAAAAAGDTSGQCPKEEDSSSSDTAGSPGCRTALSNPQQEPLEWPLGPWTLPPPGAEPSLTDFAATVKRLVSCPPDLWVRFDYNYFGQTVPILSDDALSEAFSYFRQQHSSLPLAEAAAACRVYITAVEPPAAANSLTSTSSELLRLYPGGAPWPSAGLVPPAPSATPGVAAVPNTTTTTGTNSTGTIGSAHDEERDHSWDSPLGGAAAGQGQQQQQQQWWHHNQHPDRQQQQQQLTWQPTAVHQQHMYLHHQQQQQFEGHVQQVQPQQYQEQPYQPPVSAPAAMLDQVMYVASGEPPQLQPLATSATAEAFAAAALAAALPNVNAAGAAVPSAPFASSAAFPALSAATNAAAPGAIDFGPWDLQPLARDNWLHQSAPSLLQQQSLTHHHHQQQQQQRQQSLPQPGDMYSLAPLGSLPVLPQDQQLQQQQQQQLEGLVEVQHTEREMYSLNSHNQEQQQHQHRQQHRQQPRRSTRRSRSQSAPLADAEVVNSLELDGGVEATAAAAAAAAAPAVKGKLETKTKYADGEYYLP